TERTTKVSNSTPKATAKPISVTNTSGSVPSAAKVPASTTPAEVITPPVAARPTSAPRRVPWRPLFSWAPVLVDPGHQEDVVVGTEGDQEHERPQRQRRVGPREAEQVVEGQGADAQRSREGQHPGGDQKQGAARAAPPQPRTTAPGWRPAAGARRSRAAPGRGRPAPPAAPAARPGCGRGGGGARGRRS